MDFKPASNEVLIERLSKGDERAFKEIYTRFWKKLYAIAIRKIDDSAVVEGIVQDVFLKLWERRYNLNIDNLEAYLMTSVRYACINHIKVSILHEKYELHAYNEDAELISNTEQQLDLDDLMNTIDGFLNEFPDNSRHIFRLHRLEHLTTKEISIKLKIPQRTVELYLSQVVKGLRAYLHDYL